jgi:hypothetical protein
MSEFKQYRRSAIAELRPVTEDETFAALPLNGISISEVDLQNGSPKIGDMIARNPQNHNDQWLVAAEYFEANFEEIK